MNQGGDLVLFPGEPVTYEKPNESVRWWAMEEVEGKAVAKWHTGYILEKAANGTYTCRKNLLDKAGKVHEFDWHDFQHQANGFQSILSQCVTSQHLLLL